MTPPWFTIPFLLASDFGNLWAFVLVLPAIGVSLLLATIFRVARKTTAHRACGLIAILLSAIFMCSIGDAREDDQLATLALSVVGGCLGLLFMRAGPKGV